jgi:hypothetical protein
VQGVGECGGELREKGTPVFLDHSHMPHSGQRIHPLEDGRLYLHTLPLYPTTLNTYQAYTPACSLPLTSAQPLQAHTAAVTRECWDCGRVCASCADFYRRSCHRCKSAYCIAHNTGCDEKIVGLCQACNVQSRRGYKMRRLMMIDLL